MAKFARYSIWLLSTFVLLRSTSSEAQSSLRPKGEDSSRIESALVEQREKASMDKSRDQDRGKGATEQDPQNQGGNTSIQGHLGHRDEDSELKNADSDLSG
jgi:hypothetical protein